MPRYVDLSKMPQLETWESCCEGEDCVFVAVEDVIQALRQAEAQTGEVAPVVHATWIPIAEDRVLNVQTAENIMIHLANAT